LAAYGDAPDLITLAAAYAYGIGQGHAFVDGNKRVSAVVTELFLQLNAGVELVADDAEIVRVWLAIADGKMSEEQIAAWLREHVIGP
jgi:death-on-curing protein